MSKRIVVAFQLSGEPGRRKFGGFLRYMTEKNLDWRIQLVRIPDDLSADLVRSFPGRGIDGIVYSITPSRETSKALSQSDIPTVALDCYNDVILRNRTRNLVYVTGTPEDVGRMAAHHFLSQGVYRSYAFVPDLYWHIWSKLRGEAFIREMRRNGFPVETYRLRSRALDLSRLSAWLKRLPKPVGVFAAFDDRAIQVLEACCDAGLSVPHDVAVIGVDNDETVCTHTTPPLTSIEPDHETMGYLAAQRLDTMMDGERLTRPEHHRIGVRQVVVRESTAAVSNAGKLVQRALAFIRLNIAKPIRTRDVVAFLKVSRRLADLRFGELQGTSIGATIRDLKLEETARRLRGTTDTVENIASDLGFAKVSRLREMFRAKYGMTMTAYREAKPSHAVAPQRDATGEQQDQHARKRGKGKGRKARPHRKVGTHPPKHPGA